MWAELARTGNSFTIDKKLFSVLAGVFVLTLDNIKYMYYLCAILNNPIALFYLEQVYTKLDDTGWQWKKEPVEKIPIPKINSKNQKIADELVNSVDEILKAKEQDKNANTQELENKINFLVYKLYNLTEDEIKIIESK